MVDQVHHLRVAVIHLVLQVDEERLEVVDNELGWRQGIKWVAGLLFLRGLGGGSGLLLSGLFLFLDLEDRFDALLGNLDLSEDANKLRQGCNTTEPGAGLWGGLCEALVQEELERVGEHGSKNDVGDCAVVADEPVTGQR